MNKIKQEQINSMPHNNLKNHQTQKTTFAVLKMPFKKLINAIPSQNHPHQQNIIHPNDLKTNHPNEQFHLMK